MDVLKAGILYAMKENLMIQFVYPDYELPDEYKEVINSIDHSDIVSSLCEDSHLRDIADVVVFHDYTGLAYCHFETDKAYVLRTSKEDFFSRYVFLKDVLGQVGRLNIVFTDLKTFAEHDFNAYNDALESLAQYMNSVYAKGQSPQLNVLTDRIMLSAMNNCGAGDTNITLAPNGKYYVCPAFYYENKADSVGDLEHGPDINNRQLYKLEYAPICLHCDAYQCKRCVWLNRKTTLEVNTPSYEQCVVAHLERNASRELFANIRKHGTFLPEQEEIEEIDYLDPFEKREEW